mmetsp:Transcript_25913/g.60197  ORF Transcript_25913/g.60197 Transcript_25913/m.60197 type:complete len:239 (+) Transcript_25913:1-717(+)
MIKEGSYAAPRSRGTAFDAIHAKLIDHGHTHKVFSAPSRPPSAASLRPHSAAGRVQGRGWPDFRETAWTRDKRDALFRAAYCQPPRKTVYVKTGSRGKKEFAAYVANETGLARYRERLRETMQPPAQHMEGFDDWLANLERALVREVGQREKSKETVPKRAVDEDKTLRAMYEERRDAAQKSEKEMRKNLKGTHRWMLSQEEGYDMMNPFIPDDLRDSDEEDEDEEDGDDDVVDDDKA